MGFQAILGRELGRLRQNHQDTKAAVRENLPTDRIWGSREAQSSSDVRLLQVAAAHSPSPVCSELNCSRELMCPATSSCLDHPVLPTLVSAPANTSSAAACRAGSARNPLWKAGTDRAPEPRHCALEGALPGSEQSQSCSLQHMFPTKSAPSHWRPAWHGWYIMMSSSS